MQKWFKYEGGISFPETAYRIYASITRTLNFLIENWCMYIGGGTGGPHGPRPPHYFFWGAWPSHF